MITPDQLASSGREDGEQAALFCWAAVAAQYGFQVANAWVDTGNLEYAKMIELKPVPRLKLLFAIPNGGLRDKITAARLKATGVKTGVPDIMLPVARDGYHGLFIELKRRKVLAPSVKRPGTTIVRQAAGVTSRAQEGWQADLLGQGYLALVLEGWRPAADALRAYLA